MNITFDLWIKTTVLIISTRRGIILNYVNFIVSSGEEIERFCVQYILAFTHKDFIRLNSLIFSSDRGVDRFPRNHLHTLTAFQQL